MSDVSADQIAATVQDYGHQLGRIEDLVQELDSLRLHCPALSSVKARNTCVSLVFLGLEAEIKFSVNIQIGESLQSLSSVLWRLMFSLLLAVQPCLCAVLAMAWYYVCQ